ncbi:MULTISPECIES: hypothetical protein [unclassified Pseudomonas]|uniref:hypothetical protein n=1 Tax=unclassified Pseudomonas TaxID=196821 RepID=UPI0025D3734C|nr:MULTISPECIES: hypothetical protein [unclassified Pseudomonas]
MEYQAVISHLSDDQIEELYRRYIDGERNADLVDEYKIDVSPNNLIKVFPPIEVPDLSCPYCNLKMYQRRKSKGDFTSGDTVGFCNGCQHKSYLFSSPNRHRQCGCSPCAAAYQQLLADRERLVREKIYQYWEPRIGESIRYEALDLQEKVYLVALINAQANVSFSAIKSAVERSNDVWLAPSPGIENEMLLLLYRRRIIAVDPDSPASAFDSENIGSARVNGVRWIINIALDGELRSSIDEVHRHIVKELSVPAVDFDSHQLKAIAKSVLTEQAIQQIHYQCGRLSLPFSAEKKSTDVVGTLLHNHSLAAVCYFAYLAVRRASDYYLGANVSKTQASNIIPGKCRNMA